MSLSPISLSGETPSEINFFISVARAELLITPSDAPRRVALLHLLSSSLVWKIKKARRIVNSTLDEALNAAREVCALMSVQNPDYVDALDNLGYLLRTRSNCTNSIEDLDLAIVAMQRSLELTPISHPEIVARLHNVGNALRNRFEHRGWQ